MSALDSPKPRVCFFGIYDPGYSRNRVLMRGFRENGYEVIECRVDPRRVRGARKYWQLYRKYRAVRHTRPSMVIVAFPGHTVVWLARLLFGKPIIFDAFVSLYDSNVSDRKVHGSWSVAGFLDRFWDWSSVTLASVVLLDTKQHIDYFVHRYGAARRKFIRVWVGTDDEVFHPLPEEKEEASTAHFHGYFIPLHGVPYIIAAADILRSEPITFRLVGRGQEYPAARDDLKNRHLARVALVDPVPYEELPRLIASATICLGIFGDTGKTLRAVPNKVYEYLAMGKPIITADTPAIRELAEYGELPFVLVPAADAAALAEAIRALQNDPARRRALGAAARRLFEAHFAPSTIVADLLVRVKDVVRR